MRKLGWFLLIILLISMCLLGEADIPKVTANESGRMGEWLKTYGVVIGAFIAGLIGILMHEYKSWKERILHRKSVEIELKRNLKTCRELFGGTSSRFHVDRLKTMYVSGNLAQIIHDEKVFNELVDATKRMEDLNERSEPTRYPVALDIIKRELASTSKELGLSIGEDTQSSNVQSTQE